MHFAASYSGGKDSALALYRMIRQGHTPVALITTINIDQERSWFHGIQKELLSAVSQSLDIPMIFSACKPADYVQVFEQSLRQAREMGAETCVFGDIDIEDHREWNEARCKESGLKPVLPLWQEARESVVQELLDKGFRAIIKTINDSLDTSFLGQDLSPSVIDKIKAAGADPCGENGEYHTFVYDGPTFAHPIPVEIGRMVDFGTHKAIDIVYRKTR